MLDLFKIKKTNIVLFSIISVSIGSILFGYTSGVISGALIFISKEYSLNYWSQGVLVSLFVFGAAIGAFIGGIIADKYGRKLSLFFTSILFIVSTFIIVYMNLYVFVLVGRIIQGISVGIVSVVVPLYLSEIAPTKY